MLFFINCLYLSITYILLVMNFCIVLCFLEISYSHYFVKIKKLRFCILFTNQIKTYISFFLLLIPPEGSLKPLNLIDIQLVYCSEFIDRA